MENFKAQMIGFGLRIPKLEQWCALCWPHNTYGIIDINNWNDCLLK